MPCQVRSGKFNEGGLKMEIEKHNSCILGF